MYCYNESINLLISRFPKLKLIYDNNVDDYMDLPYVFYESVFVKYIMDKVNSRDSGELISIFNFIEDLLLNGDEKMINLVEVSIIESLYYEENFNDFSNYLFAFCNQLTRESFDDCINNVM